MLYSAAKSLADNWLLFCNNKQLCDIQESQDGVHLYILYSTAKRLADN